MLPEGSALAPEAFRRLLEARARVFGAALDSPALDRMARFLGALDRARRRTNLTGPFPSEDLVEHALESALGERWIPLGARVADIGSGAGFPGIPLAIARPDIRLTPVEPRRKRAEFLDAAVREAGLVNVAPCRSNTRNLPPASVDVATARAVGRIERIVSAAPWLAPGAIFLAWTTEPEALAARLEGAFRPGTSLAVPGSRNKTIASFQRLPG